MASIYDQYESPTELIRAANAIHTITSIFVIPQIPRRLDVQVVESRVRTVLFIPGIDPDPQILIQYMQAKQKLLG